MKIPGVKLVVVGLGNPMPSKVLGRTVRHNVGYSFLDSFVNIEGSRGGFLPESYHSCTIAESHPYLLAKPHSFMNLSGSPVKRLLDNLGLTSKELLVVHDDITRPIGRVHLKEKGSASGHNGIRNIIQELGTDEFSRICIGVGSPLSKADTKNWVLEPVSNNDENILQTKAFPEAIELIHKWRAKTCGHSVISTPHGKLLDSKNNEFPNAVTNEVNKMFMKSDKDHYYEKNKSFLRYKRKMNSKLDWHVDQMGWRN